MKYVILTILCLFSQFMNARDYNPANYAFAKINGEIGLSHNGVKAIIQDSDGFIWLGTKNKLNRYDGVSIKIFNCEDSVLGRKDNSISSLYEDNNKIIWVGTDNGIFLFNPLKESFTFFDKETNDGLSIKDWVADIMADKDNNLWIVIPNQGLFRYNTLTDKLHYYNYQKGDVVLPDQENPQCICLDYTGKVWVGTNGSGVYAYNKEEDCFKQYLGDKNGDTLAGECIYTICNRDDDLIIGVHEGKLRKLNKKLDIVQDINVPEVHYKIIRCVAYIENELWVGTQNGLYIIEEQSNTVINVKEDMMDNKSLSNNAVEKIFKDREGGIWIGTIFGGVNYLPPRSMKFDRFVLLNNQNSIRNKMVSSLLEDRTGNIWITSVDSIIDIYNPTTGLFQHLKTGRQSWVSGLFEDKGNVVVGYFKNGGDVITIPDYKIRHYGAEELGLNESTIYTIYRDRFDRLWIGNGWSVFILDERISKIPERQPRFGMNFVYDIVEDTDDNIWVATLGNGVYKYNIETDSITHFRHVYGDSSSISSNSVSSIYVDTFGKVWFSTDRGGICCYNKDKNNFTSYSIKDGFPDDVTYKILEDKHHNLWFGTNNGLVKFNPETKEVKVFQQSQGLPGNQFLNKAALVSRSGRFYFGGVNGLVAFDPYQFTENAYIPPVFITKLSIYNREAEIEAKNSPLQQSITNTKKIVLKYNQANIGFEFVALSYATPKSNRYAYKMESIDNDWIYTDKQQVSYANLPAGKYTFKVKASNNDGQWNQVGTYLDIEILPPWWLSKWAYLIYYLLFISSLGLSLYWYNKRIKKQQREQQRLFEIEKEKEMYVSKVDFFTNIAHEIRTPVTLINCPLDSLLEMDIEDLEVQKNLQIMKKNASELQSLISQLLDFRKVGESKFRVSFSTINFSDMIQSIYSRFEPTAEKRNKKVEIIMPEDELFVPVDKEAMTKILSNLFSNALAYSDSHIEIRLTKQENKAILRISNDGDLIPREFKDRIFDPFYQLERNKNRESSSGIGLSLARTLTELHNGELYLDIQSELNTFVLELPTTQPQEISPALETDIVPEEIDYEDNASSLEMILVVEDNADLLTFVVEKLANTYRVVGASNAKDALEILKEKRIDLLISDVMMPDMDGFELCQKMKADIEHSHIPIILLTAKYDLQSKIKGLESGADAYIEKPFSFKYLTSQISTLLANRKREKEAFMQKPFLAVQQMGMTKSDEQFLESIIDIINERITDVDFTMEGLAELVCLSRSSLHRKIKALTELSPADFVRLIRLKKAAEIIQSGNYSVSEVCYLVGIHSPSYFTKIFRKQFGMTPKDFRDSLKAEN